MRELPRPGARVRPAERLAVQLGGPTRTLPGLRAVPSLRTTRRCRRSPSTTSTDDGNDSDDQGPTGGLDWDGRADSAHEQARRPAAVAVRDGERASTERSSRRLARVAQRRRAARRVRRRTCSTTTRGLERAACSRSRSSSRARPTSIRTPASTTRTCAAEATLTPGRGARARAVQRPGEGQLRELPPGRDQRGAFPRSPTSASSRSACRATRRSPRTRTPRLLRPRPVRPAAHRPRRPHRVLRPVPHAVAAQRRAAPRFFHNGVDAHARRRRALLRARDTRSGALVSARDGRASQLRRPAPRVPGNVDAERAVRPRAGRQAGAGRREIADIVAFLKTLTDGDVAPPKVALNN